MSDSAELIGSDLVALCTLFEYTGLTEGEFESRAEELVSRAFKLVKEKKDAN